MKILLTGIVFKKGDSVPNVFENEIVPRHLNGTTKHGLITTDSEFEDLKTKYGTVKFLQVKNANTLIKFSEIIISFFIR